MYKVYEIFSDGKRFFRFESDDKFNCEVYIHHHYYDCKYSKLIIVEDNK